ncbi:MAG: exodeoxyribonuclease V subunit gamma [Geodermatophilaceae bacterium]|nr:exodeoxyribonuclease V subunit gamma [Geodermatophilaceae bacterium]
MYVHRAESGHALVAGLAAVLAEPPDDPFVPDLIAVPTQGIERWLAQQLSHHLGAGTGRLPGWCRQHREFAVMSAGQDGICPECTDGRLQDVSASGIDTPDPWWQCDNCQTKFADPEGREPVHR